MSFGMNLSKLKGDFGEIINVKKGEKIKGNSNI
jgi:hypothetical protein